MYDHHRRAQAAALCARCPVDRICLWATLAAEALDEPYRHGVAGGLGPTARARLVAGITRGGIGEELAAALEAGPRRLGVPDLAAQPPRATRYRRRRRCKGCPATIRQPRAGRPQLWCCSACQQRATRDKALDAARSRQRWATMAPEAKERRRAAMAARWAALSPEERQARTDRLRRQRQQARRAA